MTAKLGPGVDLELCTFHIASGLFFQRQTNGDVRVMVTNGEWPLATGANLVRDFTVPHQSWCSAVAHTSALGDTLEGITLVEYALRSMSGLRYGPGEHTRAPYPEEAG